MTFLTILGDAEILCSFKLVLEGKSGKEIPESSRLEFLEKFSANSFALSDAEDNTFQHLKTTGQLSCLQTKKVTELNKNVILMNKKYISCN